MWRTERRFLGECKGQAGMNKDTVFGESGGWVVGVGGGVRDVPTGQEIGACKEYEMPSLDLGEGRQEGSTAKDELVSSRSRWPRHGEWAGSKPASFWPAPSPRQPGLQGPGATPFADPLPSLPPASPLPLVQIPTS